jgi:esterase/lipase
MLSLLGAAALVAVVGGLITRPAKLDASPPLVEIPGDVDAYLAQREALVAAEFGVVDDAEKHITWIAEPGIRSEYVLVYLHGFSATRQEIAPVPELVAKALGANLFETRLTGHGRKRDGLVNVTAEAWMEDGAEALAIAKRLGEKIILMGVSTGVTLAIALARHPDFASVDSLVLISPNFGPAGGGSGITTGPYGPQLTRMILGKSRSWTPANDLQGKYWTTAYPTASIVEMMRLVDLAQRLTPETPTPKAMLVYSPKDDVVSVEKLLLAFDALPAKRKEVYKIDEPESLSPHVLTGDILAPGTSAGVAERISAFLQPAEGTPGAPG